MLWECMSPAARPARSITSVASVGMQEVAATARVTGYYAVAGCAHLTGSMPAAAARLSDHSPVVVDIQDRDLD